MPSAENGSPSSDARSYSGPAVRVRPAADLVRHAVLGHGRLEPVGRPDEPVRHEPAVAEAHDAEAVAHRRGRAPTTWSTAAWTSAASTPPQSPSCGRIQSRAVRRGPADVRQDHAIARPRRAGSLRCAATAPRRRAARRGRRRQREASCRRHLPGRRSTRRSGRRRPEPATRRISGIANAVLPARPDRRARPGASRRPVVDADGHQLHGPRRRRCRATRPCRHRPRSCG